MVRTRTVFVIGAGASKEVGLPLSSELTEQITSAYDYSFSAGKLTHGDGLLLDVFRLEANAAKARKSDVDSYVRAARRISTAMPQAMSIDSFVDQHRGDLLIEKCAKLAIVRMILRAEHASTLKGPAAGKSYAPQFARLRNTWFAKLWTVLTGSCTVRDLAERLQSFTFVVFNYDRCLEHFLYHSIQNYYGTSSEHAAELLRRVVIHHPYGSTGSLDWQPGQPRMTFGDDPHAVQIHGLSSGIKTFTEGADPTASDIDVIRSKVAEADLVVFLGFAFHNQNLHLLAPSGDSVPNRAMKTYLATAYGMSRSDTNSIRDAIPRVLRSTNNLHVHVHNDLTCAALFDEYRRTLALPEV